MKRNNQQLNKLGHADIFTLDKMIKRKKNNDELNYWSRSSADKEMWVRLWQLMRTNYIHAAGGRYCNV
jgi:hypothetical protein